MTEEPGCRLPIDPIFGDLTVPSAVRAALDLGERQAAALMEKAKARNTRIAYRKAWGAYVAWCDRLGLAPLTGDVRIIGMYLAGLTGCAPSTIRQRLAAIRMAHRVAGVPLDTKAYPIAAVLQGIERTRGRRPQRQAAPVLPAMLRALLGATTADVPGLRDRAMLLVGFGAALRRSELTALDVGDVAVTERGVRLVIRFSKTDPYGEGQEVAIHGAPDPRGCPRRALADWLAVRGTTPGPLFVRFFRDRTVDDRRLAGHRLTDHGFNRILKDLAVRAGLDAGAVSGHSLRAGFATTAALAGGQLHQIMRQTRHRSADMARRYIRDAEIWDNNISREVFAGLAIADPRCETEGELGR